MPNDKILYIASFVKYTIKCVYKVAITWFINTIVVTIKVGIQTFVFVNLQFNV